MRSVIVAGVGGLLLGHILWLILISLATGSSSVNSWMLVISLLVTIGAVLVVRRAMRYYENKDWVRAAFFGALPLSPAIFTVIVLGVTYL